MSINYLDFVEISSCVGVKYKMAMASGSNSDQSQTKPPPNSPSDESSSSEIKILFWNVSGIMNKNVDFWNYVRSFDILILIETWLREKNDKGRDNLSLQLSNEEYYLKIQFALESGGNPLGGIIIGIKKKIRIGLNETLTWYYTKDILGTKVKLGKYEWMIFGVFNREGSLEFLNVLKEAIEEHYSQEESYLLIGGDFNAKTDTLGGLSYDRSGNHTPRNSECQQWDRKGYNLVKIVEQSGWGILNGTIDSDRDGNFTYKHAVSSDSSTNESVIDYVITNIKSREFISSFIVTNELSEKFKNDNKMSVGHRSLEVTLNLSGNTESPEDLLDQFDKLNLKK